MEKETGLKFNWTVKEKAKQKLEEEQSEKESLVVYQNIMVQLGLEVIR